MSMKVSQKRVLQIVLQIPVKFLKPVDQPIGPSCSSQLVTQTCRPITLIDSSQDNDSDRDSDTDIEISGLVHR